MSGVFANGTEGRAWMDVWCQHCAHDHESHEENRNGPRCAVVMHMMFSDDWPEAIMPQPKGEFHLPPLHLCGMFTPCEPCGGDPLAEIRVRAIAHTTAAWTAATPGGDA